VDLAIFALHLAGI
jgi:heme/copper-type cytochrome/quinol oxidase subunit 1